MLGLPSLKAEMIRGRPTTQVTKTARTTSDQINTQVR